jgi:hypothetical protein
VLFYVLFVCKYGLYYCHRLSTQLQLTCISYHIISYHILLLIRYCVKPLGWCSCKVPEVPDSNLLRVINRREGLNDFTQSLLASIKTIPRLDHKGLLPKHSKSSLTIHSIVRYSIACDTDSAVKKHCKAKKDKQ